MDRLFRPWRYAYVTRERIAEDACVLCAIGGADSRDDAKRFVVHRAAHHFVVLNVFPYNSGHLMVVPYLHAARLSDLEPAARGELADLTARAEAVLEDVYHPAGLNVGMNLGEAAGAGIDAHLHLHLVPRWSGDANFMSVVAETRVLPEALEDSWRRLHDRF